METGGNSGKLIDVWRKAKDIKTNTEEALFYEGLLPFDNVRTQRNGTIAVDQLARLIVLFDAL